MFCCLIKQAAKIEPIWPLNLEHHGKLASWTHFNYFFLFLWFSITLSVFHLSFSSGQRIYKHNVHFKQSSLVPLKTCAWNAPSEVTSVSLCINTPQDPCDTPPGQCYNLAHPKQEEFCPRIQEVEETVFLTSGANFLCSQCKCCLSTHSKVYWSLFRVMFLNI